MKSTCVAAGGVNSKHKIYFCAGAAGIGNPAKPKDPAWLAAIREIDLQL